MDFGIIKLGGFRNSKQKFFELQKGEERYFIPQFPERPTHLRVCNGEGSWGISAEQGDKKTGRGKFFKIPDDQINYVKLYYFKDKDGHHYGKPSWHI